MTTPFRISIVPGVTPGRWVRVWEQRMPGAPLTVTLIEEDAQLDPLRAGAVEMAFARLPVEREGLGLIPLYSEVPVAVMARGHPAAELADLTLPQIAEELLDLPGLTVRQTIDAVAGGAGVVVLPKSVARLYQRKDVAAVPVTDLAETQVGLLWAEGDDDPRVEEFIAVVRGRTAHSSRGPAPAGEPPPRKRAAEKAAAKRSRAAQRNGTGAQPSRGRPARRRS